MFMGGWGADAQLKNEITSALNATYANVDIDRSDEKYLITVFSCSLLSSAFKLLVICIYMVDLYGNNLPVINRIIMTYLCMDPLHRL